jgi:Protein of unknown function (DUF1579)
MRHPFAIALAVGVFAAPALAQEAPKPGPEHARLAYFAGTWQFDGESKDTPMGPGGKLSGTDTCEWFAGGFQLVCKGDMTGPRGAIKSGSIWAYDPAQRVYTLYGFNSMGEAFHVTGTVAGKVWTWMAEFPVEGASMKMKATINEESATAYAYRLEMSADGTTWMVVEEGRATKRGQ